MERRILIYGARQLLTLRGANSPRRGNDLSQLHIIEDGAILIGDGKILEVGPSRRVENLAAAKRAEAVAADGCVVMPAFIDPDTRTLRTPAVFPDTFTADPFRCPCTTSTGPANRIRRDGKVTLAGMLRHGTATVEAKGGDIRTLRVISQLESPVEVIPTFDARGGVPEDVIDTVRRRRLARFVQCRMPDTLRYARTLGFGVRQCGASPKSALADGVHAVTGLQALDDTDISALSVSPAVAVLAPGVSFHDADCYPPARRLISSGAAVALATGYGPCTNGSYSQAATVALACRKMGMLPAEAITAATINAAYALGIGLRAGSLEPGKQADVLMLQTGDYRAVAWDSGSI
jgi:imidazolonepropionase